MQDIKAQHPGFHLPSKRTFILISVFIVLILIAIYVLAFGKNPQTGTLPKGTITLSQQTLEEKYGLRVHLVALTAAGGFVDLRLKIVDAEKAKSLLQDSSHFPALFIDKNIILKVPQEVKEQDINFTKDSTLFFMYPNTGNFVKPNARLRVLFGDMALEPVDVQ